jgi:hypothetical protein
MPCRCLIDAAIQGAYEQWREFGRRMRPSRKLRALHPDQVLPDFDADMDEEAAQQDQKIGDDFPELDLEAVPDVENRAVTPDVGVPSPMEIYQASINEQRVAEHTGLPRRPIERHPAGHKGGPDDG